MSANIHRYDIQPFAVILTRSVLLYITHLYLSIDEARHLGDFSFQNIELVDSLASHENTWSADDLSSITL